jgi:hypothetical protein
VGFVTLSNQYFVNAYLRSLDLTAIVILGVSSDKPVLVGQNHRC